MNTCILTCEGTKLRMIVTKKSAEQYRSYRSKNLKRVEKIHFKTDPCDNCLIAPVCTLWCDEKNDYLWD